MSSKSQRVLSCVLCQERKIKCDRNSPCNQCAKAKVQCVPASLAPRQRRRRFPERELLERIRRYEGLLQQNNIDFEPLHVSSANAKGVKHDAKVKTRSRSGIEIPTRLVTSNADDKSGTLYEAKDVWDTMNQMVSRVSEDDDDDDDDDHSSGNDGPRGAVMENLVRVAWDHFYETNDHLLFGSRKIDIDLSTMHPPQAQMFRLWQIYLDNVDRLLKVTHAPTLQSRIIEAASNTSNIEPSLDALMFGIYCVALCGLDDDECLAIFYSSKKDLLVAYQFACQQSLARCELLKTSDQDCLTALYLYLISVRSNSDPRSLSSMLGVAMRIAQRMGIHNESTNVKHTPFEAETRRRLWWSLVSFDARICEMADHKATILNPIWDCRLPLNVNDADLSPESKVLPVAHAKPTDALFLIVRARILDFVRNSVFHLDFTNPALKVTAKSITPDPDLEGERLLQLELELDSNYFNLCDDENPLHFMTTWTTRSYIAKNRLLEHYARYSRSSTTQTDSERDEAFQHALRWLKCDTKVMLSPLTKGFHWFAEIYFPFPAYIHLVQDLKKRPHGAHAERAWQTMDDNARSRSVNLAEADNPFYELFSKLLMEAWAAYEGHAKMVGRSLDVPGIIRDIKFKQGRKMNTAQAMVDTELPIGGSATLEDPALSMPLDFEDSGQALGDDNSQAVMDYDINTFDWSTIDPFWNPMDPSRW